VLFFGALDDADDALVEFAIGGLSNLFTGGQNVISLFFDEEKNCEEAQRRMKSLLALLDRPLNAGRNDIIIAGALVCLTCVARHGIFPKLLVPELTQKLDHLETVTRSSSSFVSKNHVTLLRKVLHSC